jgi:hypothetical protein
VKCDKAGANANWVPQQTLLVAMMLTQSSISSAAEESDITREDVLLGPSSTRSRTSLRHLLCPKPPYDLLQAVDQSDLMLMFLMQLRKHMELSM